LTPLSQHLIVPDGPRKDVGGLTGSGKTCWSPGETTALWERKEN